MFTPAEMSEVDIFVYDEQIDAVAQAVARFGAIHLAEDKALGQWATGGDNEWSGRASQYASQERRIVDLLEQLGQCEPSEAQDDGFNPRHDVATIEQELHDVEQRVSELRGQEALVRHALERWRLVVRSMETLAPLWVSVSELKQLQHLHLVAGTIPTENVARLEASLFRIPYTVIPVHRQGDRSLVFAFCAQEHAPILDRALESAFLEPLALPEEYDGTTGEVLQQVRLEESQAEERLAHLQEELREIARQVCPNLLRMLARVRADRTVAEAMAHFGHREHVYLIAGWVPKSRVAELRSVVEAASHGRATIEENRAESLGSHRQVPTLLKNPAALRGVQGLVSTYGLPGYREIDPTPLVALTFVAMFGIMFGDLGHGLVLALVGLLVLTRLVRLPMKEVTGVGSILLACGLSSAVFGLLYGSIFGMEDLIRPIWVKPMRDIPTLLLAGIVFGVVVLNIGYACRMISAARQHTIRDAIFDKNGLAGFLLYWSLGGILLLAVTGRHVPGVLIIGAFLLIVALYLGEPLANLLKRRPFLEHGSGLEFAVQSFFELFETLIGYVSNTLSYVRLGAFAVAHAGLSSVVLILADMLGSRPGMASFRLLVLVVGNIGVILFEGMIVAIQTLRLEYYELFGKFFVGEGIPFKPLSLPTAGSRSAERT